MPKMVSKAEETSLMAKKLNARGATTKKKVTKAPKEEDEFSLEEEGPKSSTKSAQKKQRAAEAATRRAENKKLAQEEMEECARDLTKKKAGKYAWVIPKVTAAQLALYQEAENKRLEAQARVSSKRESAISSMRSEEYNRLVDARNTNWEDANAIDAHDLNSALAQFDTVRRFSQARLKAHYKVSVLQKHSCHQFHDPLGVCTRTPYKPSPAPRLYQVPSIVNLSCYMLPDDVDLLLIKPSNSCRPLKRRSWLVYRSASQACSLHNTRVW